MSSGAASPVFDLEWMTLTSVCLLIDNPESISGTIRLSLLSISEDFFFLNINLVSCLSQPNRCLSALYFPCCKALNEERINAPLIQMMKVPATNSVIFSSASFFFLFLEV